VTPEPEKGTTIALRFGDKKINRQFKNDAMFQVCFYFKSSVQQG